PPPTDPEAALADTARRWTRWTARCLYDGPWREAVLRSLMTLKALTHRPTGGIVAAPTTSLPEAIGGVRNWDYRYCWLRDATFTLYALLSSGYHEEAIAWREWLLRSVAGQPSQLQIMYGLAGERRLNETTLPWLAGYEGSRPVRIGNDAHRQLQLDVFGEVMDCLYVTRQHAAAADPEAWKVQKLFLDFLETHWDQPDDGLWEVRGGRRQFTHSKVMAWVAVDRAIKSVEAFGLEGPLASWRSLRRRIHDDVLRHGFDAERGSFVQYYGGRELDAALLMIPLVGFLPWTDVRVLGTVEAIRQELMTDGLVMRSSANPAVDGLPPGEGAFLACSFWLADNLAMQGRREEACAMFERLLSLRNDLGLLSEEYDTTGRRLVGNFPQAFSHVALVNTAHNLSAGGGPAHRRSSG
ncbi:MAG TPA: glycoside hydrolase family 15 protein, partial [Rhodospirillaceae bacterium]|nr:glycoside hydrolase family 15 protein [Rhodospirillaceae bacterium]